MEQFVTSEEQLTFTIETDKSAISVDDLIKYVSGLEDLLFSINHTLNLKYSAGYDTIELSVLAIEKGSFKIPISIKKKVEKTLIGTISTILGGLVLNALNNNNTIDTNGFSVPQEILLENKDTVKAVTKIAQTAVESNDVRGIAVDYEKAPGEIERVTITKEQLKTSIRETIDESEPEIIMSSKAHLIIVSPVLESKSANWKVRFEDNEFSAKMTDENFLEIMDKKHVAFGKGDILIADLETRITRKEGNIPNVKHCIKTVYQYPQYSASAIMQQTSIDFEDK
jgi:hypothetical protein